MSASRLKYVAPNLVTCCGLAIGMFSVAESIQGHTVTAAWLVIVAVLLDKLDGTVARLLKASSNFGVQMDSFSDLITFGVAPATVFLAAVVAPEGGDSAFGGGVADPLFRAIAFPCAFVYVIAAALRLAKFNVLSKHYGDSYFFGLTTTLSGALLAALYLTFAKYADPSQGFETVPWLFAFAHAGLALLMVSSIPLPKLHRRGKLALDLFQYVNVALAYLVGFTWFFFDADSPWRVPEYLLAAGLLYVGVGVGWSLAKGVRPPALPTSAPKDGESDDQRVNEPSSSATTG